MKLSSHILTILGTVLILISSNSTTAVGVLLLIIGYDMYVRK